MTRRPMVPTEQELRAMVSEGRRNLATLKAAVREALLNGAATGPSRDQIAELRGRLAEWQSAISSIAAQDARATADRIATLRTRILVGTMGSISDQLVALQPPPHPTIQGA